MDNQERQRRLTFAQHQFEIAKMYALYWHAQATTGACKLSNSAQGRQPTEAERAEGIVVGFRPHTDEEKVKNALDTMNRHIVRMNEIAETISELMES